MKLPVLLVWIGAALEGAQAFHHHRYYGAKVGAHRMGTGRKQQSSSSVIVMTTGEETGRQASTKGTSGAISGALVRFVASRGPALLTGPLMVLGGAVAAMPGQVQQGCEDMAEGNEFVRKLQQRSSENYEASMKKKLLQYNYNNFKDYFGFKGQVLTIRRDGTFAVLDKKVHEQLEKQGKVLGEKWLVDDAPPEGSTTSFLNDNMMMAGTPPPTAPAAAAPPVADAAP